VRSRGAPVSYSTKCPDPCFSDPCGEGRVASLLPGEDRLEV
jgi:hypothetical protein